MPGAWARGGPKRANLSRLQPPGGSVGSLNSTVPIDSTSGLTERLSEGGVAAGAPGLHRRVASDAFHSERVVSEPEGDQLRASSGEGSPSLGSTPEEKPGSTTDAVVAQDRLGPGAESSASAGVAAAMRGVERVALSSDVSREQKGSIGGDHRTGHSDAPRASEGTEPFDRVMSSEGQALAAGGPPVTSRTEGDQTESSRSNRRDIGGGGLGFEPAETGSLPVGSQGAGPRVGPPLMDDVFEDGPDVSRLRREIHQREEDIR